MKPIFMSLQYICCCSTKFDAEFYAASLRYHFRQYNKQMKRNNYFSSHSKVLLEDWIKYKLQELSRVASTICILLVARALTR